jgi:NAD(P)-dependent dehydrogenase (short-subunit alcohol dehydrogenase family)
MNSAAVFSHATGDAGRAKDGFDMNYGVNALGPMLLVREFLKVLEGGEYGEYKPQQWDGGVRVAENIG